MDAVDVSGAGARAGAQDGGAIVLVGFMGAGKTSGVRSLAAHLDCQPLDSDHELERTLGR